MFNPRVISLKSAERSSGFVLGCGKVEKALFLPKNNNLDNL
jgi:hypothetical protein